MIATWGTLKRGVRNVVRSPIRLLLVVVLLGTSLTFTAAMVALNSGAQKQISDIRQQVGTAITISPPFSFGPDVTATLSSAQVQRAEHTPGVAGATTTVAERYRGRNLYGTSTLASQFRQFAFGKF